MAPSAPGDSMTSEKGNHVRWRTTSRRRAASDSIAVPATSWTQMRQRLETVPPEPTKTVFSSGPVNVSLMHACDLDASAGPAGDGGTSHPPSTVAWARLQHMALRGNVSWLSTCDFMEPKGPVVGDCAASHMQRLQAHEFLLYPHHWSLDHGGDGVTAGLGRQHRQQLNWCACDLTDPKGSALGDCGASRARSMWK